MLSNLLKKSYQFQKSHSCSFCIEKLKVEVLNRTTWGLGFSVLGLFLLCLIHFLIWQDSLTCGGVLILTFLGLNAQPPL